MPNIEPSDVNLSSLSDAVVLIGAGKMGGAMLQTWLRFGLAPDQAVVFEPKPAAEIASLAERDIRLNPAIEAVPAAAALVIAVKPQLAAEIIPPYAGLVGKGTTVVSIMAGKTLRSVAELLPSDSAIVRAMPNTPAAIGRGITVAVANARVLAGQRLLAHSLLAATGAVEWIDDETLMDAVTAVSGSGPAYVFLLAEELARAGVAAGLPAELAATLARATVSGAGELLHQSNLDPATLRRNVTSPGGTTAAALDVLMSPEGFASLLERAVAAAARRSRELAG